MTSAQLSKGSIVVTSWRGFSRLRTSIIRGTKVKLGHPPQLYGSPICRTFSSYSHWKCFIMTYISNFTCLPDAFYKYSNTLFPSVIGGSEVMENGLLSGGKPRNDQSRLSWISSINFKCAKRVSCLPRIQNTLNKYSVVLLTLLSVLQT